MKLLFPPQTRTACTDASLDDDRLYRFVRDSRLPHGTFEQRYRLTPDRLLWAASLVVAGLLITAAL